MSKQCVFAWLAFCGSLALTTQAYAGTVRLAYKWKRGDVHRFQLHTQSSIEKTSGQVRLAMRWKTKLQFSQRVLQSLPNGAARVRLDILKLTSKMNGQTMVTLRMLPASARSLVGIVDRHGQLRLTKRVGFVMREERLHLVAFSATAQLRTQGKDIKVKAYASIQVKARTSIRVKRRVHTLSIRRDEPVTEVLPQDLFKLMVLPKGSMTPGRWVSIKSPITTMKTTLKRVRRGICHLVLDITPAASSKGAPATGKGMGMGIAGFDTGKTPKTNNGGFAGFGMGKQGGKNGGGGMAGFGALTKGLPGMGKGGMGGSAMMQGMMPKINAKIELFFAHRKGRLLRAKGKMQQVISQMGLTFRMQMALRRIGK